MSWLCISTPLPGLHFTNPRLNPSEIGIAAFSEALLPTGELTAPSPALSGVWKPITLNVVLRDSGSAESCRPSLNPFRSENRATRLSISARDQVRTDGIIINLPLAPQVTGDPVSVAAALEFGRLLRA